MPTSEVEIEELRVVAPDVVAAFARLIPQLSSSSPPPTEAELAAIVDDPDTTVLVARIEGEIVGALTLVVFRIPTGVRAWIEDVVVDEGATGGGIGTGLTRAAMELAGRLGARTVDLTSRPSRVAANHLYQRLGFEVRQTNLYRYTEPDVTR